MYVRRASFVLAVALIALAPLSRAAAQAAAPRGQNQWAVLVGIEDGGGDSGLALRGDLELVQRRLAPEVGLSIVGSFGYTRFGDSGGGYSAVYLYDNSWSWGVNLLKFSGSARFNFGHSHVVHPYADAGLGLYYAGVSGSEVVYDPYYGYISQDYSDSSVGLMMRFAGGVTFQLSPAFALGVELGFNPYFGDIPDDTFTSLMASATFRM